MNRSAKVVGAITAIATAATSFLKPPAGVAGEVVLQQMCFGTGQGAGMDGVLPHSRSIVSVK